MPPSGGGGIVCPYITDGLIFWLDGIERGGVTGQWKDLIGGKIFTLVGCTESTDGVTFAGTTSSYGVCTGAISSNWQTETIEIATSPTQRSNACLLSPSGANSPVGIGYINNSGLSECSINLDGTRYARFSGIASPGWNRFGGNKDRAIINGSTVLGRGSDDSWGKNQSNNTYLGVRYTTSFSRPYSGKIHSVRIYDRLLSADEIKANQAVDAQRFNLS